MTNFFRKKEEENNGLVEIKHDNEDNDDQFFELNEKTNNKTNESNTSVLSPPKPLPEGVHTLRIPSPIQREIKEIDLNTVSIGFVVGRKRKV